MTSAQHVKPKRQRDTDPALAQIYPGRSRGRTVWFLTYRLPGQGRHVSRHATQAEAERAYDREVSLWERVRV
jgi:hypothetical protein